MCRHGCRNGGSCVARNSCVCKEGFAGKMCEQGGMSVNFTSNEISQKNGSYFK